MLVARCRLKYSALRARVWSLEHACNGLTSSDPNGCSGCANSGHKWLDFNSKIALS